MIWSRRFVLSAAVCLAGCPATPEPKPPPQPVAQAEPTLPPIVTRFAEGMPARTFEDERRAERVQSVLGELDAMLQDAHAGSGKGHGALAAGVVVDGSLLWSRGYGQRTDTGGAVDDTTVFRIGSITKTFTGMAALRLRDEGKLNLNRPAHTYLRALGGVRYPTTDDRAFTVRQLLTHTSGLARDAAVEAERGAMTQAQLLSSFDGMLLQTPSLDVLRYSNLAVGTVGILVGAVEDKPYREVINTTILEPLGMRSTYWTAADVPADKLATGHTKKGVALPNGRHLILGPLDGAGSLYASLEDMVRFTALHLSAWPPRSDPDPTANILRRSSLRESHTMARFSGMHATVQQDDTPYASANGTGIAWQVQQTCGIEHLVWHNGATTGYTAALFMAPRLGIGIILLSSGRHSVTGLADRALHKLVADAGLEPRRALPGPGLERIVKGPIARAFHSGAMTENDFDTTFTQSFRSAIPHPQLNGLHQTIFKNGGACTFAGYLAVPSPSEAWVELTCAKEGRLAVHIVLTHGSPQRIASYQVRPARGFEADQPSSRCKPKEPDPALKTDSSLTTDDVKKAVTDAVEARSEPAPKAPSPAP